MTQQQAPSPDYRICDYVNLGSYETNALGVIPCPGCEDLFLAEPGERLCEACAQYDADDRAAAQRFLADVKTLPQRSGGMNDPRFILCEECGEEAGSYTGYADHLDGKAAHCTHCDTYGCYSLDGDESGAQIRFRKYTVAELHKNDLVGTKVCVECLGDCQAGTELNEHGVCKRCSS